MTLLVQLLEAKIASGVSVRALADDIGINHVTITQYLEGGSPKGRKNKAILSNYFGVEATLLSAPAFVQERRRPVSDSLYTALLARLTKLSPDNVLKVIALIDSLQDVPTKSDDTA